MIFVGFVAWEHSLKLIGPPLKLGGRTLHGRGTNYGHKVYKAGNGGKGLQVSKNRFLEVEEHGLVNSTKHLS